MARARLLKPGFFTNDQLAELPVTTRLLFAGLWTLADRKGRLEDRPKRIKVEVLPYDDVDMDRALDELDQWGFIHRYTVQDEHYIQIASFARHQSPNIKEPESTIPAPCTDDASTVTRTVRGTPRGSPEAEAEQSRAEAERGSPKGSVTEEFLDEMQAKFPSLDVRECWEEARNHKAINKRKDKRRYLRTWLRNEVEYKQKREPQPSQNGKTSVEIEVPDWVP